MKGKEETQSQYSSYFAVKVELFSKRKGNEKYFKSRSSKQQRLNDSLVLNHNIVSVCLWEMG